MLPARPNRQPFYCFLSALGGVALLFVGDALFGQVDKSAYSSRPDGVRTTPRRSILMEQRPEEVVIVPDSTYVTPGFTSRVPVEQPQPSKALQPPKVPQTTETLTFAPETTTTPTATPTTTPRAIPTPGEIAASLSPPVVYHDRNDAGVAQKLDEMNARIAKLLVEKKKLNEAIQRIDQIQDKVFKVQTLVDLAVFVAHDRNYKTEADQLYSLALKGIDALTAGKEVDLKANAPSTELSAPVVDSPTPTPLRIIMITEEEGDVIITEEEGDVAENKSTGNKTETTVIDKPANVKPATDNKFIEKPEVTLTEPSPTPALTPGTSATTGSPAVTPPAAAPSKTPRKPPNYIQFSDDEPESETKTETPKPSSPPAKSTGRPLPRSTTITVIEEDE